MKPDAGAALMMEIMRNNLIVFLAFFWFQSANGQVDIPVGDWRTHFSYFSGTDLVVYEQEVFVAAGNGFYSLDKSELSTQLLSKIDGFSDVKITALGKDPISQKMIIGYENGNIDVLDGNEIINIDVIKNAALNNSKEYNQIYVKNGFAYLSAGFGVVILDISKDAVKETLSNIGNGGSEIKVNSTIIHEDSIFIATENGIQGANLNSNLLDFNNWKTFGITEGLPEVAIKAVSVLDGQLIAGVNEEGIYQYTSSFWTLSDFTTTADFESISENSQGLLICLGDQLFNMNLGFTFEEIQSDKIKAPQRAFYSEDDEIWLTDAISGLIRIQAGQSENFIPSGPFSPIASNLTYENSRIFSFQKSIDQFGNPLRNDSGFDLFSDGTWSNYNNQDFDNVRPIAAVQDLNEVVYDPSGSYYFSSFGYGLMIWDGENNFEIFDENSPGSTLVNADPPERNTFISGVDRSSSGIWVTNYDVSQPLHFRDQDGVWTGYTASLSQTDFPLQLLSVFNAIWMRIDPSKGGGLVAFNYETNQEIFLTDSPGFGDLPSKTVNDIALDEDGQVWVGTDLGIVFFPNPFLVFDGELDASVPIFENRPLLRDERITAIEIDGGNRIWVGTDRGVWLFGEGTDELVYNFTEDNSPLISNQILDIAIHDKTGEVFFATSAGIQSFRGTATKGAGVHQNVKIFPNPVRHNFDGLVGLTGLVNNAIVKITDVSGKLVQEVRANGGTATWNVSDFSGARVSTGVYLIFSASSDGEQTFVGKIAVLE